METHLPDLWVHRFVQNIHVVDTVNVTLIMYFLYRMGYRISNKRNCRFFQKLVFNTKENKPLPLKVKVLNYACFHWMNIVRIDDFYDNPFSGRELELIYFKNQITVLKKGRAPHAIYIQESRGRQKQADSWNDSKRSKSHQFYPCLYR